jgi:predicted transposase YbfD/YdcC
MEVTFEDLRTLRNTCRTVEDPRTPVNILHPVENIIAISIAAIIAGAEGPKSIARWASSKNEWLRTWIDLPDGKTPSRDCLRTFLGKVDPVAFQACFFHWLDEFVPHNQSSDSLTVVAIDGKTMRHSFDTAKALRPLHLVSAWVAERHISLGQVATEEKSNEITAIPELLDQIDIEGATVTIDAMGCQKAIAKKIKDDGGDYVLAVKDNHPKLYLALQTFFLEAMEDDFEQVSYRYHETHGKGHGRLDERYYYLAKLPDDFAFTKQWAGIKAIGMVIRITENSDGTTSQDVRYFIVSRYLSGERFAQSVRGHWGIENSLHWVLDVTFNEDQSRTRKRRMADNLSWLRRFAISLLKQHPSKNSIKGKSQIAGWSNDFLLQVLTTQRT